MKRKYGPWIDIMTRFEGPVVNQMHLLFASDWMTHNPDSTLDDFPLKGTPRKHGILAQVCGDGPTERRYNGSDQFGVLIQQAQTELIITTPYFVPDNAVLHALCSAALRGVDITLVLPRKNDSWIVAAASRSFYRQLLASKVKIVEHQCGLLHAKTITVDGLVTMLGSSNIDLRSFDLNYENDILFYDADLTGQVIERQKQYISQSVSVSHEDVVGWPLYLRIWNNIVGTLGPVL